MSRLPRGIPIEGKNFLEWFWELGYNFTFTQANWKGEILNDRDSEVIQKVASALGLASYEWEDKQAGVLE